MFKPCRLIFNYAVLDLRWRCVETLVCWSIGLPSFRGWLSVSSSSIDPWAWAIKLRVRRIHTRLKSSSLTYSGVYLPIYDLSIFSSRISVVGRETSSGFPLLHIKINHDSCIGIAFVFPSFFVLFLNRMPISENLDPSFGQHTLIWLGNKSWAFSAKTKNYNHLFTYTYKNMTVL